MKKILLGDDISRIVEVVNESKANGKGINIICKELGLSDYVRKQIGKKLKAHGYIDDKSTNQYILATDKAENKENNKIPTKKKSPATKPKNEVKVDTEILARIEQLEMQMKSLMDIKEESKNALDSLVVRTLEGEWKNKNYCIYPETEQKLNEIYSKYSQYKRTDIINTLLLEGIDKYL